MTLTGAINATSAVEAALRVSGISTTSAVGADVRVVGARAEASATARPGEVVIAGNFKRSLTWSRTGDYWFAEVHDANGQIVAVAVHKDAQDVFLVLAEDLLPPEKGEAV